VSPLPPLHSQLRHLLAQRAPRPHGPRAASGTSIGSLKNSCTPSPSMNPTVASTVARGGRPCRGTR
jgi:hypothetical protein